MPLNQGWTISPETATLSEALMECGLGEFSEVLGDIDLTSLSPETTRNVHESMRQDALVRADKAFAVFLEFSLGCTNLDAIAIEAFRDTNPGSWENKGLKDVAVTLPSGSEAVFRVTYLLERISRRGGRKKRHGNRGETGRGVYPALEALGIDSHRRLTPLVEEEILFDGLAADAFRLGHEMANRGGFEMSWTGFVHRFHSIGSDKFDLYRTWLEDGLGVPRFDCKAWEGQRIVICPDGGRLRLREEFPGRPRDTGYHRFDAPWREPKLFVIYAIDEEGKMLQEPRPIVDGIIRDNDEFECPADELFDLMSKTLAAMGVRHAKSVSVLGDGADWIWNRARPMLLDLGVDDNAIHECIDWFHVESAIWTLSTLPEKWGKQYQASWRNRVLKRLHNGNIDDVINLLAELKVKKNKYGDLPREDFFRKHAERLRYDRMRALNLPEGSGAIESVIRRVVNLRMKGNSKYWNEDNAQHTLFLRAQLQTGRFASFMEWTRAQGAAWWTQADRSRVQLVEVAIEREARDAA